MTTLQPCPLCGSAAALEERTHVIVKGKIYVGKCLGEACGFEATAAVDPAHAADLWNAIRYGVKLPHKVDQAVLAHENERQGKLLYSADAIVRRIESGLRLAYLVEPTDTLADRLRRIDGILGDVYRQTASDHDEASGKEGAS